MVNQNYIQTISAYMYIMWYVRTNIIMTTLFWVNNTKAQSIQSLHV